MSALHTWLHRDGEPDLLRFTTAGSVDDGKSTLIGRLLHDSRGVYEDQLAAARNSPVNRSGGPLDRLTLLLRTAASWSSKIAWLS